MTKNSYGRTFMVEFNVYNTEFVDECVENGRVVLEKVIEYVIKTNKTLEINELGYYLLHDNETATFQPCEYTVENGGYYCSRKCLKKMQNGYILSKNELKNENLYVDGENEIDCNYLVKIDEEGKLCL